MYNKEEDNDWIVWNENLDINYNKFNYNKKNLQLFCMELSHKLVEKEFDARKSFDKIIEIGAGTGEHFQYVKHDFKEYIMTDRNQKVLNVAKDKNEDKRIQYEVHIGEDLPFPDNTFDRLIAVHVLEHIYKPHIALKEWARVVKNGGIISILIPTDPGLAWRLGRKFGPRRRVLKKGIPYDYIMAREHVNSCYNLLSLLRYYFPENTEKWSPFCIPFIDINLYLGFNAILRK